MPLLPRPTTAKQLLRMELVGGGEEGARKLADGDPEPLRRHPELMGMGPLGQVAVTVPCTQVRAFECMLRCVLISICCDPGLATDCLCWHVC